MNLNSLFRYLICFTFILLYFFDNSLVTAEENKKENWTPELSMKYKNIRETTMSPDGNWIAYVVRMPVMDGEKSEYLSHIWIVSADGKINVQYTQGNKSATNPAFSPDGTYLAFTSSRTEKNQIWIMRVMGGEAEQLTNCRESVSSFKWSPDGKKIAFTMQNPETEEEEKKKKEKLDVIFVDKNFKYNHLYTIKVFKNGSDKRDVKRLTAGDFHVSDFDWSPDGKIVVFTYQSDPKINTAISETDISIVPSDSGIVTPLVKRDGVDRGPLFSPDGKWIAFTSHGGKKEEIGLREVYIISPTGGTPEKLGETPDRNAQIVAWSKDSKSLFLTEWIRTSRHIISLPINGNPPNVVTENKGYISAVSVNKNADRVAFTYQNTEIPPEVYISFLNKFNKKKLTDVNEHLPKPEMGLTKVITWKSKDGLEIEGLLTYPVKYKKGKSYPLILNIHGGPAGVFGQSFTGEPSIYIIQTFAQNGYAILRPNPRGSTGYGKKFRYANFRDWGHGDYDDLMTGVDSVIEMGIAHKDSLCVMGWSYGGYLTSFTVTRTNRFKAASMGAGLCNLISMATSTSIPNYLAAHMGAEFWEDYEIYEKYSATYRIKNVKTPTQVIHGADDINVPFTQGVEFYSALYRMGVPTEMIVYPRTQHIPNEPKFMMDITNQILVWFDKHLGRSTRKK